MEHNDAGIRWLYSQLPDLTARGVLTAEAAAALRENYGAPKTRVGVSVLVAVIARASSCTW